MGLRQHFRFQYAKAADVRAFLRNFSELVNVEDKEDFFVFTPRNGEAFAFDCEILPSGLLSDRSGNYFNFLGMFIEALTGQFGPVQMEDA
jgi:hypothetical protein